MTKYILRTLLLLTFTAFSFTTAAHAQEEATATEEASQKIDVATLQPKSDFTLPKLEGYKNLLGEHQILTDALAYYDENAKVIKGFYLTEDFAEGALEGVEGHSTTDPEKIEGIRRGLAAVTPRIFFYESRFNGNAEITEENFATVKEQIKKSHEEQVAAFKAGEFEGKNAEPLEDVPESETHITTVVNVGDEKRAITIASTSFWHKQRVYHITAIRSKTPDSEDHMKVLDDTKMVIDAFIAQNS